VEHPVDRDEVLLFKTPLSFAIVTLVSGALFVGGFLLGYLPVHSKIADLEAQNVQLRQNDAAFSRQNYELQQKLQKLQADLKVAELRGTAGLMSYRASQNNFGAAAELSTSFFNGVSDAIGATEDQALKENLQKILDQRDVVTAALAQANPIVKERLAQIYAEFLESSGSG
jgi:hypothetical protein